MPIDMKNGFLVVRWDEEVVVGMERVSSDDIFQLIDKAKEDKEQIVIFSALLTGHNVIESR